MLYPPLKKLRYSVGPSICLSVCLYVSPPINAIVFHTLLGAFFDQFSPNLLWELILGRGVLGLQLDTFWQISTEFRPLIEIRNCFSLYLWHSFTDFLQTWYDSRYFERVFWDCRWVNFDKLVQSYSSWFSLEICFHYLWHFFHLSYGPWFRDCLCIENISWWGMMHACSAFKEYYMDFYHATGFLSPCIVCLLFIIKTIHCVIGFVVYCLSAGAYMCPISLN